MKTRTYATPKYRKHPWIDTRSGQKRYGIQASIQKGKWMHMAEDGVALIFDTEAERDAKLMALRKNKQPIPYSLATPRRD